MPIFERGGQKIHFVHIPKTGGMSIREMLKSSGWINRYEDQKGELEVSPYSLYHGHMPYSFWKDWDAAKDCDFEFAVVRNPITRMSSLMQMWLRSFFLNEHSFAFQDGGMYGPGMRKFFVDNGCMRESDSDEVLRAWVGSITWPENKQAQQAIAQANGITVDQMRTIVDANLDSMMKRVASKNIESIKSKTLADSGWIDVLVAYMNSETFEGIERVGLTPCPMYKYISNKTCTYKFEEFEQVTRDLVDRGLLNPGTVTSASNSWPPLNDYKLSSWNDSPAVMSEFYDLYDRDFELFGYSRDTPFPNMRESREETGGDLL